MSDLKKLVIPAAGFGTRFLPATKAVPKEMLPVLDKPLIQYAVEEAVDAGIRDVVIVTSPGRSLIRSYFAPNLELDSHLRRRGEFELADRMAQLTLSARIEYVEQPVPRGLGDAVLRSAEVVGRNPFAVLLPDDFIIASPSCTTQLLKVHLRTRESVVALMEVPRDAVGRYGIAWGDPCKDLTLNEGVIRLRGLIEKPEADSAPSRMAVIGRYILHPEIFDELSMTRPGIRGEVQLTDALQALSARRPVFGVLFSGRRFDAGDKAGLLSASVAMGFRRNDVKEDLLHLLKEGAQ